VARARSAGSAGPSSRPSIACRTPALDAIASWSIQGCQHFARAVGTLVNDARLAADLRDRCPCFRLSQIIGDLRARGPGPLCRTGLRSLSTTSSHRADTLAGPVFGGQAKDGLVCRQQERDGRTWTGGPGHSVADSGPFWPDTGWTCRAWPAPRAVAPGREMPQILASLRATHTFFIISNSLSDGDVPYLLSMAEMISRSVPEPPSPR